MELMRNRNTADRYLGTKDQRLAMGHPDRDIHFLETLKK
jgi:hypothetical protein